MSRYLYLDFDGVIFTRATYASAEGTPEDLLPSPTLGLMRQLAHPASCDNLRLLLEKSSAQVILSTAWRQEGVPLCTSFLQEISPSVRVIGQTPRKMGLYSRRAEISLDLHRRKLPLSEVVIVDDDISLAASGECFPRWVRTSFSEGFTEAHLRLALALWGLA